MLGAPSPIVQRIRKLQSHLERENPVLLDVVKSFRQLDRVAYHLGMLDRDDSFATKVPWWPMVSVLGTFSSGKSTFLNGYLGEKLQKTGNQAVDDKFTVICFGSDDNARVLPGRALDADPRFPFYQMSQAIEEVAPGEGERIDTYLQLKTCRSETLRGKIFIDSPGFDADEQRNSTLRITDRIIDLSDLVLVFFDARHPEPGAMQDTLDHLVARTIARHDSNKFLYILNQIDNAAREDNPEEVFAAWQRALSQKGLTAGRFYALYNPGAAIPIEDPKLRERFRDKRDSDMAAIDARIQQVEVERAYRIIGLLEKTAKTIQDRVVPALRDAKRRWRRRVAWLDAGALGLAVAAFLGWSIGAGRWTGLSLDLPLIGWLAERPLWAGVALAAVLALALWVHYSARRIAARTVEASLRRDASLDELRDAVVRAFRKNVRPWRFAFTAEPAGWGGGARRRIARVLQEADRYVQTLNSRFADPSGAAGRSRRGQPGALANAVAAAPAPAQATSGVPSPPVDYSAGEALAPPRRAAGGEA
ncbi:MAG: dynamin family protein [Ectothiorhodospiraceae bacterium]|nr:dynamin family protein [Chromatiales bacterium]MCP5156982.1 dynamin family protein [Ectothiorhodospiraceae bacterium]